MRRILRGIRTHQIEWRRQTLELRRAQAELDATRNRYAELYHQMPLGCCTLSQTGFILEANLTTASILGVVRDQLVGQPIARFIVQEDMCQYELHCRQLLETAQPQACNLRMLCQDGTQFRAHLLLRACHDAGGAPTCRLLLSDISQAQQAEEALHQRESYLSAIIENQPGLLWLKDAQSRFLSVNHAFVLACGRQRVEDVVGKTDLDVWPRELGEKYRNDDLMVMQKRTPVIVEEPIRDTGETHWFETFKAPVFDEQGQIIGTTGYARDITERKRAEETLRSAKESAEAANRVKDQFIAKLSHELRTPLTPVLLAAAQWQAQADLPASVRGDLAMVCRNLNLEARMLDDLLDVNRILHGKLSLRQETLHVHQVIAEALTVVAAAIEAGRLKITLQLQAGNDCVSADPARVQQILWNLLTNAIKFTPEGGSLCITTSNDAEGELLVQVADTGRGIEPELLSRLFEPFEQGGQHTNRHYGGLGLGLTICKSFMELHGGSITAQSEGLGHGATFTLRFPTVCGSASVAMAPPCTSSPAGDAPQAGRRVLLVEDHPDTGALLSRLLRSWGHEVRMAGSVASALEAASAESFDLLISDLGLPDGSGHDLMRQLAARGPIQAIAVSGYGASEDIRQSRDAGFAAHLTKPVTPTVLREAIRLATEAGACRQADASGGPSKLA